MSGTKRVPVTRTPIPQITPRAIELFQRYRRSNGTSAEDLHYALWEELHCKPWEYPCVEHPDALNPYPPGSPAAQSWRPDERAQEMWKALDAASREARRAARRAEKAAAAVAPDRPPPA